MPHKILIIDDDVHVSEMLTKFLRKLNYQVATVESGEKGLEKLKKEKFSLVLCDVVMPKMDGIETLNKIRGINESLPVVMMSGFATHDRIVKSLEKGANDFIAKPVSGIQANKIIKKILDPQVRKLPGQPSPTARLLREGYLGLLNIITNMIEIKNSYIKDHGARVSKHAIKIAQAMQLPEGTIEVISCAALLHDLGKVGVSDLILSKPDKLNDQEWDAVKMHATIGSGMVEQLKFFTGEEPLIRHHHEWYNGHGYPSNLKKEEIPLGARIIHIADAYDAMTSPRPYRPAMTEKTAKQIIKDRSGKQFDPKLCEIFFDLF